MGRECMQCGQAAGDEDIYCAGCGKLLQKNEEVKRIINQKATVQNDGADAPLSLEDYMLIGLILLIPIVNIIVFLIWAFDKQVNTNRKNLAKAGLIYLAIGFVLSVILGIGIARAVMLDQQYYPEYDYFDYEMERPGYDEFISLPYEAEET